LESTQIAKDLKEIKEHLLGKHTKDSQSDIFFKDYNNFIDDIQSLSFDKNKSELIKINQLTIGYCMIWFSYFFLAMIKRS